MLKKILLINVFSVFLFSNDLNVNDKCKSLELELSKKTPIMLDDLSYIAKVFCTNNTLNYDIVLNKIKIEEIIEISEDKKKKDFFKIITENQDEKICNSNIYNDLKGGLKLNYNYFFENKEYLDRNYYDNLKCEKIKINQEIENQKNVCELIEKDMKDVKLPYKIDELITLTKYNCKKTILSETLEYNSQEFKKQTTIELKLLNDKALNEISNELLEMQKETQINSYCYNLKYKKYMLEKDLEIIMDFYYDFGKKLGEIKIKKENCVY